MEFQLEDWHRVVGSGDLKMRLEPEKVYVGMKDVEPDRYGFIRCVHIDSHTLCIVGYGIIWHGMVWHRFDSSKQVERACRRVLMPSGQGSPNASPKNLA